MIEREFDGSFASIGVYVHLHVCFQPYSRSPPAAAAEAATLQTGLRFCLVVAVLHL